MATKRSEGMARPRPPASLSPLVEGDTGDGKRRRKNSRGGRRGKRGGAREISASRLAEEAALTARLFGGGDSSGRDGTPAWMDDDDAPPGADATDALEVGVDDVRRKEDDDLFAIDRSGQEAADRKDDGELFAIDRSGAQVNEQEGGEDSTCAGRPLEDRDIGKRSDEEAECAEEENGPTSMRGAAWHDDSDPSTDSDVDSDDESNEPKMKVHEKGVSLVDGPNRLKKLRRYRDETEPVSIKEYERRLRERFMSTASVAARTDWADVGLAQRQQQRGEEEGEGEGIRAKKKGGHASSSDEESEEEDAARSILESNASLFSSSTLGKPLPPTLLNVVRTRDGNLSDPNNSVVSAVQFHPGSDEERPLMMTAGMDKMLRFFRIDEEGDNPKVHGVNFPKMPISCASFLGDTGSVVLSGRRPFFYVYDAMSGKIQRVPGIVGRKERSLEKFTASRDGRLIAFVGNDGYVILVDGKTRQWVGDLKMNGSVRTVEFGKDGEHLLGSGSDGDVYRWHIGSRRCVERFRNEDGTITSSLASSDNFLAVGSESGVVNLYDDRHSLSSTQGSRGLALASADRAPLKSIMNLTTSADRLAFNHDGSILAMLTQRERNGLKLLHVPTATVFSNWPTSKTPLKYAWSMDFSPGSRYLAVGNDHGKCLLYRIRHYWDE